MIRVISGGQTWVDQSAWRAAKACGLEKGGWMPLGFKTEDGPRPEFADLYGAKEHTSPKYEDRTPLNVNEADLTVLIGDWMSRGSKLAYRCFREKIGETKKDHDPGICYARNGWLPVVRWRTGSTLSFTPDRLAEVIRDQNPRVINVAGNRESSRPGIGEWAEGFLLGVFRYLAELPPL